MDTKNYVRALWPSIAQKMLPKIYHDKMLQSPAYVCLGGGKAFDGEEQW